MFGQQQADDGGISAEVGRQEAMRRAGQSSTILDQAPGSSTILAPTKQAPKSNADAADAELKMSPQEKALYKRHFDNLTGPGGVDNPNGSRSTLYQSSVEHNGKTYNIPTVWDGKILPIDDAVKRVQAEGWDKFPSYANSDDAEARYEQMHKFMEQDTAAYMQARRN